MEAIKLIAAHRADCDFKFVVTDGGVAPYLVYFETRIDGQKYQVSFHSFNHQLRRFMRNSFRCKWDRKDSRESALAIYWYYVPNGEYGGDAYD